MMDDAKLAECEGWFSLFESQLRNERDGMDKETFDTLLSICIMEQQNDKNKSIDTYPKELIESKEYELVRKISNALNLRITEPTLFGLILFIKKPIDAYVYLLYIKYKLSMTNQPVFNITALCLAFASGFLYDHEISLLWERLSEIGIDNIKWYIENKLT